MKLKYSREVLETNYCNCANIASWPTEYFRSKGRYRSVIYEGIGQSNIKLTPVLT